MDFRKVTISIPDKMYKEAMNLVKKGMFSNFSDLVRSGIREEIKEIRPLISKMEQDLIYNDKELIKSVHKGISEAREGKTRNFKNVKEMEKYLKSL